MFNFLGSHLDYVDSSQDFFNGILFLLFENYL